MSSAERQSRQLLDEAGAVVSTAQYLDGKLDGIAQTFSAGVLIEEACYEAGQLHGPYRSWWHSGTAKEEGTFNRGSRVGKYRWYKLDGSLWQEHDYGSSL
jgi:antitoxin component YwqK of YwqJK toxin-antitoxin module